MAVPPESSSAVSNDSAEALRQIVAHLEAVDDYLNGVLLLQLQLRRIRQIADLTVDPRADVALTGEVFQWF